MISISLTYSGARALIIPVIEYDGRAASTSDGECHFREPMFIGAHFSDINVSEAFVKAAPARKGFDVALGSNVLFLHLDAAPTMRKLDLIDVEPGHVFHPSDPLLTRYVALRTTGSYHLYPRGNPFGDAGGRCVADTKWKKGFLRITDRKGEIVAVTPTEPITVAPLSEEIGF